jgi:hypothetical protein
VAGSGYMAVGRLTGATRLHCLQGAVQQVHNAKRLGAPMEIVVIERLSLNEVNAKHITPLSRRALALDFDEPDDQVPRGHTGSSLV